MSPTSQTSSRTSLFDSCHRKIRLIGGRPVAFFGGLVAKARRKERDGDQNSTDTKLYLEESVLERKLPEADLRALVDLPAGLDYNEWLASHTLALFEHVNLVYGTISEFCTPSVCVDMIGPGNRTYLWFDEKGKKTRVAAPQYIDYVMTFTQKTVSDESIFPTKYANEFPSSFESIARKILRLQFHVIAHLYAAHFREIALLGLHTHLNLTFAHLTALHRRFNLIDEKETDVLRDLEVALRLTDDRQTFASDVLSNNSSSSGAPSDILGMNTTTATTISCNNLSKNQTSKGPNNPSDLADMSSANGATSMDYARTACCGTASLIDGDAAAPPICTQPEAGASTKPAQRTHNSPFGGGSGGGGGSLLGGILGDLTAGEFSDASRYCTLSSVPSAHTVSHVLDESGLSSTAYTNNGGAGALHFNNNNYNNHLHNLHHHVHQHHLMQQHQQQHQNQHQHQQRHQQQQQQQNPNHNHNPENVGLIQCNASTTTSSSNSNTSNTTTA